MENTSTSGPWNRLFSSSVAQQRGLRCLFFLIVTAFRDPKPPLFVDTCSCLITYKHGESDKCTDTVPPTHPIFCILELTLQLLKKTHRFDVHRSHVRNLSDGVCFCNKFLCQRYTFGFSSSVVWSLR